MRRRAKAQCKKEAGHAPRPSVSKRLDAVRSRLHLATSRGIVERLPRDADHLVGVSFDPSQIDVLDRVVGLGHGPDPSWAVDLHLLQRAVQSFFVAETAF